MRKRFGVALAMATILVTALTACGGDSEKADTGDSAVMPTTTSGTTTGTTTVTDTTDPTDPTDPTTTPTGTAFGLLVRIGDAVVTTTFDGTEDLVFLSDGGYGEASCVIRYDLASTTSFDDCYNCEWAFEVVVSNAVVVNDTDGACLVAAGVDAGTVGQLNGTVSTRGYHADYQGHAQVLMSVIGAEWSPVGYATWDEATSTISYEWEDGFIYY